MSNEILQVLVQIPVVAAFVWYALRSQASFQRYLEERNGRLERALESLAAELRMLRESYVSRK